ncbi:ATP-binding protein [Fodinicola feengrottensis]|uniref:histidine kinase n=1 Tax=Fodinicola feengrottensis TaxID=435914 RepID=A0ABN2J5D5_9ACTN
MTARARLVLAFGALYVAGGIALIAAIYFLVQANLVHQLSDTIMVAAVKATPGDYTGYQPTYPTYPAVPAAHGIALAHVAEASGQTVLTKLLLTSGLSLLIMTILSLVMIWWLSGRVLRPVHEISALARRLSSQSLHERIEMGGPKDELTELADTFDAMLERLERSFESQRRFVANASHELRTPVAVQRTAIQVGLADPTPRQLVKTRESLLEANRRIEHLLDSLLVLARSDRGLDHREPVDLTKAVDRRISVHTAAAAARGVEIEASLDDCWVAGDPALLDQLVDNLVGNAIRHNVDGGHVAIRTSQDDGLVVSNSGPNVPDELVGRLFQPFQRGDGRTIAAGSGLGLSIVESIAHAHDGTVQASPRPTGGLDVTVSLPAAPS